jgi:2'-5' RNA ligase
VRLFLAINLEPGVRRAIADATAPLRAEAPTLSWVDEARLHLTLKFLGEQPVDAVQALSHSVDQVARRHRGFSMQVGAAGGAGAVGAFPNFRRPQVVWMGIEREPRLELLHHDIELACEQLGYDVEGRAFRPHVTLARVKGGDRTGKDELRRLARASKRVAFEEEAEVESVDVMHSEQTGASPARYERLHVAPLQAS